jgi:O-antigen/teichoic acid export membrane protein
MTVSELLPVTEAEAADEPDADQLVRRALRGTVALGLRQGGVVGLNLLGGVLLARLLAPAEFGVYAVVLFLRSFLIAFGDAGLGASLIRQPEEPAVADYRAVFTIQQVLVGLTTLGLLVVAPAIAGAYHLPSGGLWLLRLVAVSLLLTSLQSIPSVRLERRLAFGPLATAGIAEAVTFNVVAVGLAALGAGVVSFGVALAAQSLVGAVVLVIAGRWPVGWVLDWPRVRRHLGFGLPFQGILFVSLVKDSITPVLIGLASGARDVGYVRWAQTFGAFSVLALMLLQRVYLPFFSRLQGQGDRLSRAVAQSIRATNALVAPLAVVSLVLAPAITRLVFGPQWLPALPIFYLLWLANLFVPTATPLLALLNALGESRIAFGFALLWMLSTWVLGIPLILAFGAVGFGLANAAVQLTNFALFRVSRRRVPLDLLTLAGPPWVVAGAVGAAVLAAQQVLPVRSVVGLALYGGAALLAYGGLCWSRWSADVRNIWVMVRS